MEPDEYENIVIYHSPCSDGFTAAWIFNLFLEEPTLYYPTGHGEPPPPVADKNVFIVDFSYKRPILEQMYSEAKSLQVLDHHISAEKDLAGLDYCHFDQNHSGAVLAWQFFKGDAEAPLLARLVEDRDLWRWQIPGSKKAALVIQSYDFTFENWDELASLTMSDFERIGDILERYEKIGLNSHLEKVKIKNFKGYEVPVVNCSERRLISDLGSKMCQGWPFAVVWYTYENGQVLCSLRSTDEGVDVSELCSKYGGGGHKKAAGMKVSVEEILNWFV